MELHPNLVDPLLKIENLTVGYGTGVKVVTALNKVSLEIGSREIIALVGESGCGKSTLGLSIINLLDKQTAKIRTGRVMYMGKNLMALNEKEMSKLRGTQVSMIFQDPMSSLDPTFSVGKQLTEAINVRERGRADRFGWPRPKTDSRKQFGMSWGLKGVITTRVPTPVYERSYHDEAREALKKVNIADPESVLNKYPHELSGGIAQRVMIAQALIEKPKILIADEPTSALDVTSQAQVLLLMRELSYEIGSSILFITHDLAVAAQIASRVAVMYAGELVEVARVEDIFRTPLHPYTEGLLLSFPRKYKDEGRLEMIRGDVPDLKSPPPGCRFNPRCKYAFERCVKEEPKLIDIGITRKVACFLRQQN